MVAEDSTQTLGARRFCAASIGEDGELEFLGGVWWWGDGERLDLDVLSLQLSPAGCRHFISSHTFTPLYLLRLLN